MAGVSQSTTGLSNTGESGKNFTIPLIIVTALFFMWGFITCLNDILIPKLKSVFSLNYTQALYVQLCFFGAYFIISLIYFLISIFFGDPILKIGYKNAIIVGLVVAGLGCFGLYEAANIKTYSSFLLSFFILASGITILQIGANPYVALLGGSDTASSRLNMTQAFNSLGTTIAPIFGALLILNEAVTEIGKSADAVKGPYLGLMMALFLLALIFMFLKLPKVNFDEGEKTQGLDLGALHYPHLVFGILGIFMYVGGEVSIGSLIVNFLHLDHIAGITEEQAAVYLSTYWGGAMIGRFFAAVFLTGKKVTSDKTGIILANLAFAYVLSVFLVNKEAIIGAITGVNNFLPAEYNYQTPMVFAGVTVLNIIAFIIGKNAPARTLGVFAGIVIGALLLGSFASGNVAMWSILCIGLFNSVMFPTIFTLAIKGLGRHTSQGSSLLVMAIVGGALFPLLQGLVADMTGNLQISFLVPILAYGYIMFYGFVGSKPVNIAKPGMDPKAIDAEEDLLIAEKIET